MYFEKTNLLTQGGPLDRANSLEKGLDTSLLKFIYRL